jgi:hypothetical protein
VPAGAPAGSLVREITPAGRIDGRAACPISPAAAYRSGVLRRRFAWLNRPRRMLLALAAVWVIAVFDLGFTLFERDSPEFVELNPVAAHVLSGPTHGVMAYKFGLLGLGTLILLPLRRHAVAELACWFLFVAQVYLAVRWYAYYDCVLHSHINPLIRFGSGP